MRVMIWLLSATYIGVHLVEPQKSTIALIMLTFTLSWAIAGDVKDLQKKD